MPIGFLSSHMFRHLAKNLMLNLWRYLRRAVARELYATGFFTDRVPEAGSITVFYENDVEMLDELLR